MTLINVLVIFIWVMVAIAVAGPVSRWLFDTLGVPPVFGFATTFILSLLLEWATCAGIAVLLAMVFESKSPIDNEAEESDEGDDKTFM